jgi:putative flavoprotein involved in K+ transport
MTEASDAGVPTERLDVAVIGGGQSALAVGYYLRRSGLTFAIFDDQAEPGGAWLHTWDSLTLFSPAQWSSLPGWIMPGGSATYPSREDALRYIAAYEARYAFSVHRPVRVRAARRSHDGVVLETSAGPVRARFVVAATGTWANPRIPVLPGQEDFAGVQLHSAHYRRPEPYAGKRVVIVGGGNSGAQLLAELSPVARVTWATRRPPTFLPDDVDGRYLFAEETARYRATAAGADVPPPTLGEIVMVPPVREARERGALVARPMFERFTRAGVVWPGGMEEPVDAVIWATGFRAAIDALAPLGVIGANGRIAVEGTRSVVEPGLWLVGYGDWTGYASATLIGVGRSARATVDSVQRAARSGHDSAVADR